VPAWLQWVIGAATLVTATSVLWSKLFRPLARLIVMVEESAPVLKEIAAQFRTDSGSSLRDTIDRIELAADKAAAAALVLERKVETVRKLAIGDREHASERTEMLVELTKKSEEEP
jgi:hypothetical protein